MKFIIPDEVLYADDIYAGARCGCAVRARSRARGCDGSGVTVRVFGSTAQHTPPAARLVKTNAALAMRVRPDMRAAGG